MSLNERKDDLTSQFKKMYYNSDEKEFSNNNSENFMVNQDERKLSLTGKFLPNSSICNINLDSKEIKNNCKIKDNSTLINKNLLDQNKQKLECKQQNILSDNRIRYISGDASLSSVYRSTYIPQNRPRSNSEGKVKKPSAIMSTIKKSVHLPWSGQVHSKHSYNHHSNSCPITPNTNESKILNVPNTEDKTRIRLCSGTSTNSNSTINRMIERFRNRSLSMDYANPKKKEDGDGNDNIQNSLLRRHSIDPEVRKNRAFSNRCVDGFDLHQNHFSFYRDARTSRSNSYKPYTSIESIHEKLDFEDLEKDRSLIYLKFFQFYHCYDLVPISSKLIVFDTQLLVKKAFYALVNHGLRAAPLWDSNRQMFVGMLTITYFINILIKFYTSSKIEMNELEEQKLETWKNLLEDKRTLITIDPESSVLDAIKTLVDNKIHRLPIVDSETNNVIYILTHKRILKFFYLYCSYLPKPSFIDWTIDELNLGTYRNIEVTTMNAKLINVMQKFVERRISALPVVDENNKLIDIYSKFDLFNLAAEKMYDNLEITIEKALDNRQHWFENVVKCTLEDTFFSVLERIVKAEVHRIVVVDEENFVVGIISLSDILQCLTSKHEDFILPDELIKEESEDFFYRYNNNNNLTKNQNYFEEKELEGNYRVELQKIDEI